MEWCGCENGGQSRGQHAQRSSVAGKNVACEKHIEPGEERQERSV